MNKWLKTKEYAEFRGVSVSLIKTFIQKGKISKKSLKRKGRLWLINRDKAENDLKECLDERQRKKTGKKDISDEEKNKIVKESGIDDEIKNGDDGLTLNKAQTLNQKYQAALKRLEYEEKSGKLIDAEQVAKDAFSVGRKVRDAMLNIPSRISAIVTAETDQVKNEDTLLEEITNALEGLANG